MASLIYSAIASLDGFIEDREGRFGWSAPDDEVLAFVNELERPIGTYLYGRRMYETMAVWERPPDAFEQHPPSRDFGEIWRGADKIVYSTTLASVSSARTRIERRFEPNAVRQLKEAADRDLTVGGAALAAHAIEAGLVDELQLLLVPEVVGGGKRALPDARLSLELREEHRFGNGTVFLRYATTRR